MKASELIHKLSFEIFMHGDRELSFVTIDKDWNETKIDPVIFVENALNSIKIGLKTK